MSNQVAEAAVTTAAAGFWLDQSAAASAGLTQSATGTVAAGWTAFTGWYAADAVAAQASWAAGMSQVAQEAATGLFTEYIAQLVAVLKEDTRVEVPAVRVKPVRKGADPVRVHSRPAEVFKETFALTGDDRKALDRAIERSIQLTETDIMLAARQAQQDAMNELQVDGYRRVLRPELSESGPCGLCVVAANRIYKTEELLPIHDRCKCETMPIIGGVDPGIVLNRDDLKRLYAAAGDSTSGRDLKRVRVQVNEHGELGPVLTVRGQKFTGPDDLGTPPGNPELVKERLAKLDLVLKQLEQSPVSGPEMDARLKYQRQQIARTRRRTTAA